MFIFSADKPLYRLSGLVLLSLQLFLFVFALQPFQAGIWLQTEPVQLAVLLLAAANASWLLQGIRKRWLDPVQPHILFILTAAWIGWQIINTMLIDSSWRSWFGPVEIGMGVATNLAMLLCAIMMFPFWQDAKTRRQLILTAMAALLISCGLFGANPNGGAWRPGLWADYMAFAAGYVWIATFASSKRVSDLVLCGMIVFMFVVLIFADNMSANPLIGGALLVTVTMNALRKRRTISRLFYPSNTWRKLAILGCFFPLLLVIFSQQIVSYSNSSNSSLETFADPESSFGARLAINQIALSVIKHEPERLFLGNGWGGFSDDSFRYVFVEGIAKFGEQSSKDNWVFAGKKNFHSHNQPMEALLSFGLIGMALWFAIVIAAIRTLPREYFWTVCPMIVAVFGLGYFWFELPRNLAFQAMALVALSSLRPTQPFPLGETIRKLRLTLLSVITVIMLWSAWQHHLAMHYGDTIFDAADDQTYDDVNEQFMADDAKRGGNRFRVFAYYSMYKLYDKSIDDKINEADVVWLTKILRAANMIAMSAHTGPRVSEVELGMLNFLFADFHDPLIDTMKPEAKLFLLPAIMRMAKQAPKREDSSTVFFNSLEGFTSGNERLQIDILSRTLAINPKHRIALWLMGKKLRSKEDTNTIGLQMQRHAVELGVLKMFPVAPKELQEIMPSGSPN